MRITRRIIFHAGHMLKDDKSKCFHPHGHEYILECTLEGGLHEEGSERGMVINFGRLKEIMMNEIHNRFDHKFIIESIDPRYDKFYQAVGAAALVVVEFTPTAENLVKHFLLLLSNHFRDGVKVVGLKLWETSNCWAEL